MTLDVVCPPFRGLAWIHDSRQPSKIIIWVSYISDIGETKIIMVICGYILIIFAGNNTLVCCFELGYNIVCHTISCRPVATLDGSGCSKSPKDWLKNCPPMSDLSPHAFRNSHFFHKNWNSQQQSDRWDSLTNLDPYNMSTRYGPYWGSLLDKLLPASSYESCSRLHRRGTPNFHQRPTERRTGLGQLPHERKMLLQGLRPRMVAIVVRTVWRNMVVMVDRSVNNEGSWWSMMAYDGKWWLARCISNDKQQWRIIHDTGIYWSVSEDGSNPWTDSFYQRGHVSDGLGLPQHSLESQ